MKYFKTEQINMVCFFYPFMPFLIKQDETIQFCKKRIKVRMCAEKKILFNSSPSGAVQCKFLPRDLKSPLFQSIKVKENFVAICLVLYFERSALDQKIYTKCSLHECRSYKIILKCNWIPQDNCVPWAYCMYQK